MTSAWSNTGAWFLLASTVAGLAGANWAALNQDIDTSALRAASGLASETRTASPPPRVRLALTALHETIERPLFNASRRPVPPPPVQEAASPPPEPAAEAEAAAPPPALPEVKLLGTLRYGAKKTRALVQVANAPAAGWVDLGADIGGWRLREIARDYVVLEGTGTQKTVSLYAAKPVGN